MLKKEEEEEEEEEKEEERRKGCSAASCGLTSVGSRAGQGCELGKAEHNGDKKTSVICFLSSSY